MLRELSHKLLLFSLSTAALPGFLLILDGLHFFICSLDRLLYSFSLVVGRFFICPDIVNSVKF